MPPEPHPAQAPADPPALVRLAAHVRSPQSELARLMRSAALHCVFQPIASVEDGAIHAHEALIRGPQGTPLAGADALLGLARSEDRLVEFELFCARLALQQWGRLNQPGRLFVNVSADALVYGARMQGSQELVEELQGCGISPRMVVFELTEHERVTDMAALVAVTQTLRDTGIGLALDDFGDGHSSLRLWAELRPDYVKIDKYFSRHISQHADRLQTLRALKQIATVFATQLVAEGIETVEDLQVLRDLSIGFGQGYLLGRPAEAPVEAVRDEARAALTDHRLFVLPELRRAAHAGCLSRMDVLDAPTVAPSAPNNALEAIFHANPDLHAVAIVDEGRPMAIVNRQVFMQHYAQQYFKEIFGRKSCMLHANHAPRLIERTHDVDHLIGILTSQDQRYLSDGFIVTENGRYMGLGTGE